MKQIAISADRRLVSFDGQAYAGSCLVRTLGNGLRPLHDKSQVYYSMNADGSQGKPIMPGTFPSGTWQVEGVQTMDNPNTDYGPVVIRTNAHQIRKVWILDAAGGYDYESADEVMDWFYQIHFCDPVQFGIWSDGCEHVAVKSDMMALAAAVKAVLSGGESVEVVAS